MYRIGFLTHLFSFAPVAGSDNADDVFAIRESHCEYATRNVAEAQTALLSRALRKILGDDSQRICKSALSLFKGDSMPGLILEVLLGIPIESNRRHATRIAAVVDASP